MLSAAGGRTRLLRRLPPGATRADAAAAAVLLVAALAQVLVFLPIATPAVGVLIAAGSTVPIAWRRQHPAAAALIGSLVWLVPSNGFLLVGYIASLLLYYAVTAYDTDRYVAAAVVLVGVIIAVTVAAVRHLQAGEYAGGIVAVVAPAAVGLVVREQRQRAQQLERLAVLLERERDQRARAAVSEERTRIARELHDLVSHALSVVSVQADAAQAALQTRPERAGEALGAIRSATHEALQEMRRLLGVLRADGEEADLQPLPGIGALPALVERAGLAGVRAQLSVTGPPLAVLPSVDLTVYRIVQEALTNAAKHAPGTDVDVELRWLENAVEVRVRDRGPGPVGSPSPDAHGLVGMRERVRIHGGDLRAGPADGGGFEIWARLPVRSA